MFECILGDRFEEMYAHVRRIVQIRMKEYISRLFLWKKGRISILLIYTVIVFLMIYKNYDKLSSFKDISLSTNHSSDFDVVLNYYSENTAFVARFIRYLRNSSMLHKLNYRIIIYNKNTKVNNTYLQSVLQADLVYQLPNIGREGETYLHHIIHNYDYLAKHIFFCQAGVEGITATGFEDWFENRLEKQFNASVGYMPMVRPQFLVTFNCGQWGKENLRQLAEFWGILEQTICPPTSQFV